MNSHLIGEVSQVVTAVMLLVSFFTALTRGGKWILKIVEATEANTKEVINLSRRMVAVESKLGIANTLTVISEPPRHDTPPTR